MNQISQYEQNSLNKLGKTIHSGKWSNAGLVQLVELALIYLNPITLQQYAKKEKITYNGALKRKLHIKILGIKYIIDNE